mgnify:FL=1
MVKYFRLLAVIILVFCIVYPVTSTIINPPVRSVPPPGAPGASHQRPIVVYVTPTQTPVNYLTVEVSPGEATISIDGGYGPIAPMKSPITGSKSPTKRETYSLPTGTHTIRATAPGYQTHTERFQINSGDRSHISITLDKDPNYVAPVYLAGLEVTSCPTGASVYIDGRPNGTTPCTIVASAGPHTVMLRLEGYLDRTETVDLYNTSDLSNQKVFWILTEEGAPLSQPVQTEPIMHETSGSTSSTAITRASAQSDEPTDVLQYVVYFFRGLFGG